MFLEELMLRKPLLCMSVLCHYKYFLEINLKFQSKVCHAYHDVLMISINDFLATLLF